MAPGRFVPPLLVIAALLAASCATQPKEPPPDTTPETTAETATEAATTVETTTQTETATTEPASTEPQVFVASQELYDKTFTEVQAVVTSLEKIIADGDYQQWLSSLTAEYVATTGSAEYLAKASNSPILKKNGIVLKTLQDYFKNVVVRSHFQASLSEIQFVDATHVKAVTEIQGTTVILYYLVREDGRWKVGLQPAEGN
jgi:hypothetical protein